MTHAQFFQVAQSENAGLDVPRGSVHTDISKPWWSADCMPGVWELLRTHRCCLCPVELGKKHLKSLFQEASSHSLGFQEKLS